MFGDHPADVFRVCWKHYRALRSKDGILVGFRYINGKPQWYVKEYLI